MAIIYSYPDNLNILLTDMLIGTSTIKVAGKKKNITKNFTVEALGKVISTANPTAWGTIIGNLDDQTDLQAALDSKQNNITLTTIGSNGPSTLIGSVLNIPNYFTVVPTKTSELINDGEDGINPFITLADIPPSTIPNLNDVLLEGNISELDAKIGELYLYDGPNVNYGKISIQDDFFSVSRATSGTSMVSVDNGYSLTMNNGAANATIINPLTVSRTYTLPDASGTIALTSDIPAQGLTSVGLSMPVAFNVANSPLTSDGTIAVSAAGTSAQYIRGDGQLATLPTGAGGGSTVAYYLNGSINASVAGYKQLSNTATIGGGTDFTLIGNGLIAQFLTDLGNPNRTEIPGGAWNFEMFFQASSAGGNQKFYVELLKYNGTTFTLIASSILVPEEITGGTAIDLYLTSLAVPTTPLLVTDRLAIRVYIVDNAVGRTITLHTEDNTLCEIITTFSGGVTSLNGLTANTQYLAVGTTGTDFNISSLLDTHTFNLPTASALNRGALSSADWTAFNGKFNLPSLTNGSVLFSNGTTIAQDNANFFWDDTNNRLGIGTNVPSQKLEIIGNAVFRSTNRIDINTAQTAVVGVLAGTSLGTYSNFSLISSSGVVGESMDISYWNGSTYYPSFRITNVTSGFSNLLLMKDGGNVLIGTTVNQGGKLQIKAPGALSTDIALRVRNSVDTGDLMVVNGLGNVGIGTAGSTEKLTVWNDTAASLGIHTNRENAGDLAILRFSTVTNGDADARKKGAIFFKANGTGNGRGDMQFAVNNAADSGNAGVANAVMTLQAGGNIGIGTTNPQVKLDLQNGNVSFYNNTASSGGAQLYLGDMNFVGGPYATSAPGIGAVFSSVTNVAGDLAFYTYAGVANSRNEVMRIRSSNVGIGTTAPTARLHIAAPGALSTDIALKIRNSADTGDLMTVNGLGDVTINTNIISNQVRTSIIWARYLNTSNNAFTVFETTTANGNMRIYNSASIGKSTDPVASAQLEVESTTKGFLPPRMTTTQKNAIATPASGLVVYDTTLGKLCVRGASAWETITSI